MLLKKMIIAVAPLVVVALLCAVFPLIPSEWGFFSGVLRGLLIGAGLGVLLPVTFGMRKNATVSKLLWAPVVLLALLLLYQYLTYERMLRIPALSFLNVVNAYQNMIETAFVSFLGCVLFAMRK